MQKDLKDIKFITLPGDRKIGNVVLSGKTSLPVQVTDNQKPEDIDFNSIAAGLIRVIAWNPAHKDIALYKKILLELQPDCASDLNLAAISKSNKKEFDFAEELMLAVNHLT